MTPPTSSDTLGFALVGTGLIADFHAQAIALLPGCRLHAAVGRDLDRTRTFAHRHGIATATTDLDAVLARSDIQVVCVTTPSGAHLEPAAAAAAAGKHLVIEKPIEITLPRIDALLAAARAAGVKIMPIFQARYGEGARRVRQAVVSGRFGRGVLASAQVKWHRSAAYYHESWHGTRRLDGGGALMNQGIHAVDLLQWFAGVPEEVFCWSGRRVHHGIEVEDTAVASLRFPDGGYGSIEATTATWPGWARRLEVCGENGAVALEDDRIARWDFRDPLPEDDEILRSRPDPLMRSGASAPNSISHHGHLRQIGNLVDSLRTGAPLEVDGPEARKAVAIILALYESAESGQPVRLAPPPA